MRYIPLLLIFLCACASKNPIETPKTPAEMQMWVEAETLLAVQERKTDTLWMYSTGSFALFTAGLAVVAFWATRRLSGLALMAGGIVGMASVWVFDSKWFPWVAGVTVGLVLLSGLAFAWVNAYRAFVEKPKPPGESPE